MTAALQRLSFSTVAACALLFCGTAQAEGVQWRKDYATAVREARAKNLPILVKFTAEWCTYCHKMERTTFHDEGIVEHVNGSFVPVMVDADENEQLMEQLGVRALPTTVLLSPKQEVLAKLKGYKKVEQLRPELVAVAPLQPRVEAPARAVVRLPNPAGPAFGGNCLVTLREERRLLQGDPAITTTYRGMVVAFASEAARDDFAANPARYWPMWDGRCPVSAVNERESVEGIPITGAIYRDRLWFFADREHRAAFDDAPDRYLPTIAAGESRTRTN